MVLLLQAGFRACAGIGAQVDQRRAMKMKAQYKYPMWSAGAGSAGGGCTKEHEHARIRPRRGGTALGARAVRGQDSAAGLIAAVNPELEDRRLFQTS